MTDDETVVTRLQALVTSVCIFVVIVEFALCSVLEKFLTF